MTSFNFLVIEDEPLNRQVLLTILTNMGHHVMEAEDAGEAFRYLAQRPQVDAVLLDIQLPQRDGISILNELRSRPDTKELPVVCISARARPEDQDRAYQAGADGYLVKPFRRRELITALDTVLLQRGVLSPGTSITPV